MKKTSDWITPIGHFPVLVVSIVGSNPMIDFDVCLRSVAIQDILIDKIQDDFEFVVGGQRYKCPRFLATFLSPRICLSHFVDPSIAEYVVETSSTNDEFHLFMTLGSGSTIRVTPANFLFLLSLSREFGNSDLHISILEHFDNDFIRSQIQDSTTLNPFGEDLIGRISSKVYDLTWSELDRIPVSVLFHIISNNLLVISSEDDLFSYVSSRICSDPEYSHLLQFIRFEYLSSECICCFSSALPDSIDRRLWKSISRRLISRVARQIAFPLSEAKSVDGILSYLTQKHGGNVHDKGIVRIASKSVDENTPEKAPRNVADLGSQWSFFSKDAPGQWICWDFQELRLCPTHYTLKSDRLTSWVLESSLDGETWTQIDRATNKFTARTRIHPAAKWLDSGTWAELDWMIDMGAFTEEFYMASFAVSNSAECRFIRLRQTGKNRDGYDTLSIYAFEFFGTLLECPE